MKGWLPDSCSAIYGREESPNTPRFGEEVGDG